MSQGLYDKFIVKRTDGTDVPGQKHHGCRYFVIDMTHDNHAPAALEAYAEACKITRPRLAMDIWEWLDDRQVRDCAGVSSGRD